MSDIDDQIRRALAAEDNTLLRAIEEPQSIFDLIGRSFRGRMKALMVIAWLAMFACFGFALFSLFQLLSATEVGTKINWCVGVIVSTQFLAGMKTWYFLELTKLASARDIRRLELRMMHGANTAQG